jgi:hypothetical protein
MDRGSGSRITRRGIFSALHTWQANSSRSSPAAAPILCHIVLFIGQFFLSIQFLSKGNITGLPGFASFLEHSGGKIFENKPKNPVFQVFSDPRHGCFFI